MSKTERILRLKAALRNGNPILDAPRWARELGVDCRTVLRDLAFLRDKLGLSITYDPQRKGYTVVGPQLPTVQKKKKRLLLMDLVHRITAEPGKTATQLAVEMSCSSRTIYRSISDLEQLGLPIYNDRGYRFAADAFLPPLGLDTGELLSLFLAVRLLESQGGEDLGPNVRRASEKLFRGISERRRPDVTALRNSIQVASPAEDTGVGHLLALQAVIGNGYRLKLRYLGLHDSDAKERSVDPMGLFGFRQVWYLRAYDHLHSGYRSFRLSRLLDWEQSPDLVLNQPTMDLNDAVYHRWDLEGGEAVEVQLRVSESLGRWLLENPPHPTQRLDGDVASYTVSDLAAVGRWALGLQGVEVLEPADLRQRMAQMGEEICRIYGPSGVVGPA